MSYTEFQFPFALALRDCLVGNGPVWTKGLLSAISELSNVAGGHARSYFEMAPRSIVVRLTPALVAGFDTYGFKPDGSFPALARLNADDLPPGEFWIGGALARDLAPAERDRLAGQGARFFDNPQKLMLELAAAAFEGLS